jgi:hypothetical protein
MQPDRQAGFKASNKIGIADADTNADRCGRLIPANLTGQAEGGQRRLLIARTGLSVLANRELSRAAQGHESAEVEGRSDALKIVGPSERCGVSLMHKAAQDPRLRPPGVLIIEFDKLSARSALHQRRRQLMR